LKQPIDFGLHLPIIKFKGEADHSREQILSYAKKAEYLGYDYLVVNDHIVFRTTSWLDALTTLSAVAAITSRIKIGTSILNIVARNPIVCIKALAGIDILSSGDYSQELVLVHTKQIMIFAELLLRKDGKDLMNHYKF